MSLEDCISLLHNFLSDTLFREDHISKFNQFSGIIILNSALKQGSLV